MSSVVIKSGCVSTPASPTGRRHSDTTFFKLNRTVVHRQHHALDPAFEEDRLVTNLKPGIGKTISIVEAIRQVLQKNPQARVFACALSNCAADLIAERLCTGLRADVLFRIICPTRCLITSTPIPDGNFSVPPMAKMKSFRVIVSTCVAASMVSGIGMPRGHFSHIFIDEGGQATEPQAFISIKNMADPSTNVVLSGDPNQLGPIVRSPIARILGFETSYLQRLMDSNTYDVDSNSTTVVKLIKNFPSHPAILKFPNERFYVSDLQPYASANPKFPVVFHAVSGKDDREASSPSFFNVDEVLQVKLYVQPFNDGRKFRATDNEIGIITPYHAQCLKVRAAFCNVADGIKVGSVEEFQGQERKVIIISTVRSSKDFVEYDLGHTLGFVANPRRFNGLIVVGNPRVLGLDPLWKSCLNYIHTNDGWTGSMDIPWDPEDSDDEDQRYDARAGRQAEVDMNDFTRRMEELALGNAEDGANEEDANVDRPWRDVE
ncbi:P-loop containing nucleoside triphosphate hydrolase protein [Coprinopsis sp. MPI-PUGE-AT-0042]|nr:P-loop containing nucleoside triphosphate hydrolase protein [Coprinopsis sp. MPI-PUGE-AT-0042]